MGLKEGKDWERCEAEKSSSADRDNLLY